MGGAERTVGTERAGGAERTVGTERAGNAERRAAYPGTFDPPTVAHLAIAEAAWRQGGVDRVVLVLSRDPLGKSPARPTFEERLAVIEEVAVARPWLQVNVTDRRLIGEIAEGFDGVVMGTDKWEQVVDPAWYQGSAEARDRAVALLPPVLIAVREGGDRPVGLPPGSVILDVHEDHSGVSSTLVREGRVEWMLPEAAHSGLWVPH